MMETESTKTRAENMSLHEALMILALVHTRDAPEPLGFQVVMGAEPSPYLTYGPMRHIDDYVAAWRVVRDTIRPSSDTQVPGETLEAERDRLLANHASLDPFYLRILLRAIDGELGRRDASQERKTLDPFET